MKLSTEVKPVGRSLATAIDQDFVDEVIADYKASRITFSALEPRVVAAVRYMAEVEGLSGKKISEAFNKTRNAAISLCSRAKPPIQLQRSPLLKSGFRRKHSKQEDADLTRSTKYARLTRKITEKHNESVDANLKAGMPEATRPPVMQRHQSFRQKDGDAPRCCYAGCKAPSIAKGKPFCSDHSRRQ